MDENKKITYSSNSNKSREEASREQRKLPEKKIERVVSGEVKVKKKGFFSKMRDNLVSDDASSVKSYIFNDVLIPSFKKAVSDIVTNGIDIMLYGEARHSNKSTNSSRVSYTKFYDRDSDTRYRNNRSNYSYNDVVVPTKADGERILDVLDDTIATYGCASVADFYDAVGVSTQYTDNNYGWTSIASARVVPVTDGWRIDLPRAMPINN